MAIKQATAEKLPIETWRAITETEYQAQISQMREELNATSNDEPMEIE